MLNNFFSKIVPFMR